MRESGPLPNDTAVPPTNTSSGPEAFLSLDHRADLDPWSRKKASTNKGEALPVLDREGAAGRRGFLQLPRAVFPDVTTTGAAGRHRSPPVGGGDAAGAATDSAGAATDENNFLQLTRRAAPQPPGPQPPGPQPPKNCRWGAPGPAGPKCFTGLESLGWEVGDKGLRIHTEFSSSRFLSLPYFFSSVGM